MYGIKRYFIVKDGKIEGSTADYETALDMVRTKQARETHYLLRASYTIIEGIENPVAYK